METTKKTELESKIKALTVEFNFKNEIAESLPNIEILAFLSGIEDNQKRLVAKCKTIDQFNEVFEKYAPTNENTVIGTATDKFYSNLQTPFRLNIDNPCKPNQWNYFKLSISYTSNDIDVEITLPIETISDFTTIGQRTITDSEYHYFTGISQIKLHQMRVRCFSFKGDQINFYSGSKTLNNVDSINQIIKHLTNSK